PSHRAEWPVSALASGRVAGERGHAAHVVVDAGCEAGSGRTRRSRTWTLPAPPRGGHGQAEE
ncbi:hypothetical protein AB4212_48700, partial [Streptomyces sp. 2MCAF27]